MVLAGYIVQQVATVWILTVATIGQTTFDVHAYAKPFESHYLCDKYGSKAVADISGGDFDPEPDGTGHVQYWCNPFSVPADNKFDQHHRAREREASK